LELPTPLPTSDEVETPDEPEEELALVAHSSTPPSVRAERGSFASDDSETPDEPEEEFPPAVGSTPPSVRAERGSFAADNERLRSELQRLSAASRRSNHNMQQVTWMAQAMGEMWSEEKTELARRRAQEGLLRDLHDSECRDLCRMRNWTWLS